jgi:DNA-binding MarR family transcriptional regulator
MLKYLKAKAAMNKANDIAAVESELTLTQLYLLYLLVINGEMPVSALMHAMTITVTNAFVILDPLIKMGYIERRYNVSQDKRKVYIGLTDKGHSAKGHVSRVVLKIEDEF